VRKADLQLGAHAVGRTDQHRVSPSGEAEAGAEAADGGEHVRVEGAPGELLDPLDGAIGFLYAHAGVFV
jgi:hypothetical protein